MSAINKKDTFFEKHSSQIMVFPADGVSRRGLSSGHYSISLIDGLVRIDTNTTEPFSSNLTKMQSRKGKSCLIWVNDAGAKIKLGQTVLPTKLTNIHLLQSIGFDNIEIDFPTGRTPDNDFELLIIVANTPNFPLNGDDYLPKATTRYTGTATDNYTTIFDKHTTGYNQILITTRVTNGNSLTFQISYSDNGTDWIVDDNYFVAHAVANSTSEEDKFATSRQHAYYRIQVKNTVGGSNSNYAIDLRLVRAQ